MIRGALQKTQSLGVAGTKTTHMRPGRSVARRLSSLSDESFMGALKTVLGDDATRIETLLAEESITDIVLDAGRPPVVYFSPEEPPCTMSVIPVERDAIEHLWDVATKASGSNSMSDLTSRTGTCPSRPLDRLSKMHHYDGTISGLTWRAASYEDRSVPGDLQSALLDKRHTLLYGPPGSGKTTLLRSVAKHCSDRLKERVVVVDATGEIGGYYPTSDILGYFTRRMCVPPGSTHDDTIMEAVRNHTPSTIIVDEIVTRRDAAAVVSAAARGVRVIATTHAGCLMDILQNPIFRVACGSIQDATVTDSRAKANGGKKTIRERTLPVLFDHAYSVHTREMDTNVSSTIDTILQS